jgi:archaeosortase B (VPXXXP-CTERM-specific)
MSELSAAPNKKQKGHLFGDMKSLKMPLLFCLTVVILNLLSYFSYQKGYLSFFEILTAQATTGAIHLFGMAATREKTIIRITNAVWQVNTECTAITIMIIYSSFVAVYKTSLKSKGIGLLVGLPLIFAANITRLLLMAFIDKYKPAYSTYFHDYLWQVAFIIMVVFMWIVWIEKVAKRETKTPISG